MDRRERGGEAVTSLLAAFDGLQSQIWTALPGIITGWDAVKRTARILPALQVQVQQQDGSMVPVTLPELLDCPIQFAGGGGCTLTFPLAIGDECLVVFANRCIDNWWQSGCPGTPPQAQPQAEFRMHDLSDGFCIPGVSSVPKVIPAISTTHAQLRNDLGTTMVELDPAGNVNVVATIAVAITAPAINMTGAVHVTGTVVSTGDMTANGTSVHTHIHGGVATGIADTSAPL